MFALMSLACLGNKRDIFGCLVLSATVIHSVILVSSFLSIFFFCPVLNAVSAVSMGFEESQYMRLICETCPNCSEHLY